MNNKRYKLIRVDIHKNGKGWFKTKNVIEVFKTRQAAKKMLNELTKYDDSVKYEIIAYDSE